jgi:hypothetical protein
MDDTTEGGVARLSFRAPPRLRPSLASGLRGLACLPAPIGRDKFFWPLERKYCRRLCETLDLSLSERLDRQCVADAGGCRSINDCLSVERRALDFLALDRSKKASQRALERTSGFPASKEPTRALSRTPNSGPRPVQAIRAAGRVKIRVGDDHSMNLRKQQEK